MLWAKIRITLETVSMVMVAVGQNANYLRNDFHGNGCYEVLPWQPILTTVAVLMLNNQMENAVKV